jgi:hypothetical protein
MLFNQRNNSIQATYYFVFMHQETYDDISNTDGPIVQVLPKKPQRGLPPTPGDRPAGALPAIPSPKVKYTSYGSQIFSKDIELIGLLFFFILVTISIWSLLCVVKENFHVNVRLCWTHLLVRYLYCE